MAKAPNPRSGHRSWRKAAGAAPAARSRWAQRLFLTALLTTLAAIFAWIIIQFLWWGSRNLELIAITDYDLLAVPPVLFAQRDHEDLQRLQGFKKPPGFRANLDRERFRTFCNSLAQATGESLTVYVSAQGISEAGTAYLACSDFAVDGDQGRLRVKEVLGAMREGKPRTKLLILDALRIPADPRMGMVVNEFGRLVGEEVTQLGDKAGDTWVLLPALPTQLPADSYGDRRSVFGMAVVEALSGRADVPSTAEDIGSDGNGDGFVTLYELYYYVATRCGNWFGRGAERLQQIPVLLRGGSGFVTIDSAKGWDKTSKYKRYRLKTVVKPKPAVDAEKKGKEAKPSGAKEEKPGSGAEGAAKEKQARSSSLPGSRGFALFEAAPSPPPAGTPKADAPRSVGQGKEAAKPSETAAAPGEKTAQDSNPPDRSGKSSTAPPTSAPGEKAASSPPGAPAGKDAAAAKPPTASLDPEQRLLSLIERAWLLRDHLKTRKPPTMLCPVDFAPHVWREAEAHLLYFEQRLLGALVPAAPDVPAKDPPADARAGTAGSAPLKDLERLDQLVRALEALRTAVESGSDPARGDWTPQGIEDRLLKAWAKRRTQWVTIDQAWEREESPALVRLRDHLRGYHSLVFEAPNYVRWHAAAGRQAAGELAARSSIAGFLDALLTFQDSLRKLETEGSIEIGDPRQSPNLHRSLDLSALENLKDNLDDRLRDVARVALADREDRVHQAELRLLISTPLLAAADRMEVLRALLQPGPAAPPRPFAQPPSIASLVLDRTQWDQVAAQAELEERLVRLTQRENPIRKRLQDRIGPRLAKFSETREADLWEEFRALGAELRDVYRDLPRVVQSPAPADRGFSNLALLIVDPRDRLQNYLLPAFEIRGRARSALTIATVGPADSINVRQDRSTAIVFEVQATTSELLVLPLQPQFDASLIEVVRTETGDTQRQGGMFRRRVTLHVQAKQVQQVGRRSAFVRLVPGSREVQYETKDVECLLPRPDWIDLIATRDGLQQPETENAETVSLKLFPGHTTRYALALRNASDTVKNVKVELFAVPPLPGRQGVPGRIQRWQKDRILSSNGLLDESVAARSIAKIEKLALQPRGTQQHPVLFGMPSSPAAKPAEPAAEKPKPPAEKQAESPALDVSQGLLCLITDLDSPEKKYWPKWLEIEPRDPRQYLTADVRYVATSQRLEARLRSSPGEDLPRDGRPVTVTWEVRELQREDIPPKGRLNGQIASPQDVLELYAELPPDDKDRFVRLSVDGCPRAFVFRVGCRKNAAGTDSVAGVPFRQDANQVDLTRILVPGRPEVYHVAPFLDWPTEEEKPKEGEAVVPIRLAAGQPAVFQTSDKVQIHLRSDANDAFRGERDAVVIYVGGDERVRLLADRHTTAHLVRLGERGDLQLALKTEDHAVIFDPQEKNKELRVSAAIVFGERTVCSSTPVTLIMDSEPPQLGPARFEQPLEKGSKGSVQVPVVDVSPIVEARYAFADLPPRQMDDTNSTRAIPTVVGRNLLSVGVDASKLEIGKHILWLQVRDQAKWNSDIRSVEFEVAAPRKEVILGTVQGAIYVGTTQNRVNGIHFQNNVALWQGDQRMDHPVEVRSDGTFVIRKLPPGKYTLKAQGTVNNLPAVGEDTKELKFENPARTETWTIGVSRPK